MRNDEVAQHQASFRDPSGFIFTDNATIYRQVNLSYQADYDALMSSGLYHELIEQHLLVTHEEVDHPPLIPATAYKVLKPHLIPVISYPFEWSFSQLQDAALLTLDVAKRALAHDMILKDASGYNIQFLDNQPIFIDTLSFAKYEPNTPWIAYRQFCQHFLAPLALISQVDLRLSLLLRDFIDGIPLDLASKLLPGRSRWSLSLNAHIHWHAKSQTRHASQRDNSTYKLPKQALLGLLDNLAATVKGFRFPKQVTEWQDYPEHTNYSRAAHEVKLATIRGWLAAIKPVRVTDIGANAGEFSRLGVETGAITIASDIDPVAVERNYRHAKAHHETGPLPLVIDVTNPSPNLGWANQERTAFLERARADVVLCLALVHHLAISNNLPLRDIARFLADLGEHVIVEFVPKTDSNAQKLLATRPDIFPNYTEAGFESAAKEFFIIVDQQPVLDSQRTLYLLQRSRNQ